MTQLGRMGEPMSKQSQMIDPAGRCVHDRIERVGTERGYTNQWLCCDCREEFYHLDWNTPQKITIQEPYKTLRDEFAIAAMQSLLSHNPNSDRKLLSQAAYFYADGMMEYRK